MLFVTRSLWCGETIQWVRVGLQRWQLLDQAGSVGGECGQLTCAGVGRGRCQGGSGEAAPGLV